MFYMKLIFLGTSSVFPTPKRNHPALALIYEGEILLFDCGEGVQRQMAIAKLSPAKINHIFLTHWHGDHVLGLPGLLQSMQMSERKKDLHIYGPPGSAAHLQHLRKGFEIGLSFRIRVHEVYPKSPTKILDSQKYEIWAAQLDHYVPCIGFAFKEKDRRKINLEYTKKFGLTKHPILKKLQQGQDIEWKGKKIKVEDATILVRGKKITYIMDTLPCTNAIALASNADILICEATFTQELKDKALERHHMTAKQAAKIAKKAKAQKLVITHFSQRFRNSAPLLKEARTVFPNTIAARDFLEIKI